MFLLTHHYLFSYTLFLSVWTLNLSKSTLENSVIDSETYMLVPSFLLFRNNWLLGGNAPCFIKRMLDCSKVRTKSLSVSFLLLFNLDDLQCASNLVSLCCCCSVTQSCLTLCNSLYCSMPGFPVLQHFLSLLDLMSIESVMPSNHLILCFSSRPQSFPASGSFPVNQFFASGGQSIGVSASTSVLPMNIQGWFPLGWTGWISLQSKRLSRVFSNTTVQKHQFFGASFLYSPTLTSVHDYWKNDSFD